MQWYYKTSDGIERGPVSVSQLQMMATGKASAEFS